MKQYAVVIIAALVFIVAAVLLLACSAPAVVSTLEAAVDAAIIAAEIAAPQDIAYLTVAQGCMDTAASILEGPGTSQQKAIQIAAACTNAVSMGNLGGVAVQAVAAALNAFLSAVNAQANVPSPPKVSSGAMANVHTKLATLHAKLAK